MTPPPAAAAARARAGVAHAPLRQPFAPRRVSGPARRPLAVPRPAPSSGRPITRLLDAPFLDRLIRGRTWIAVIAVALFGIVAMQVAILRLGASIGRSVTQIQQLEQRNELEQTAVAALKPGRDVAAEAAALGMVDPPAGDIKYLQYRSGDVSLAASRISRPGVPLLAPADPSLTTTLAASLTSPSTSNGPAPAGLTTTTPGATTQGSALTSTSSTSTTSTSSTTPTTPTSTASTPLATPPASGGAVSTAGGVAAG